MLLPLRTFHACQWLVDTVEKHTQLSLDYPYAPEKKLASYEGETFPLPLEFSDVRETMTLFGRQNGLTISFNYEQFAEIVAGTTSLRYDVTIKKSR
jgi:hypothetical protein